MAAHSYRTALVTGASRGIGASICRSLRKEGLAVHAVARSAEALKALAAETGVIPIAADIKDTAAILKGLGGAEVDVLVNNAGGLSTVRPIQEQTAEEIIEVVSLNLTAPLLLMRALLPGMVARKRGHLFNLTSTAGHNVFTGTAAYGAAKAGLAQAGRVMRYDLAGSNVRLTEISPGRVETEFYLEAFGGNWEAMQEKMYRTQRPLSPDDIATAVMAALRMPQNADLSYISVDPTDQATGGYVYGIYSPV